MTNEETTLVTIPGLLSTCDNRPVQLVFNSLSLCAIWDRQNQKPMQPELSNPACLHQFAQYNLK